MISEKALMTATASFFSQYVFGPDRAAMLKAQNRLLAPLRPEERKSLIATLVRLIEANNHLGRTIYKPS